MGLLDHVTPLLRSRTRPGKTLPLKMGLILSGVLLSGTVLNSCSQVPDAVNPAEWYKSTVDLFAGDGKEADKQQADNKDSKKSGLVADRGKAPPGSDKSFPNLSSVDRQARARDNTGTGLTADTERPKYAPAVQRQGAATEILQAQPRPAPVTTPSPAIAAVQPPPQAMPKASVAQAPLARSMPTMPVPQPEPQMAKPTVSPKLAPPVMTADQKANEQRLAQQLAEIRSRAAELGDLPISASQPAAQGDFGTLVISSDGIVSNNLMAAAETPKAAISAPPTGPGASQLLDSPPAYPGNAVRVATILFDNGSSKLKSRDKRILSAVMRLQRKNGGQVRVIGHASSRTRNLTPINHKMTNFEVSASRADRVAGELMRLGVNKKDILIAAVSDADPAYYEIMPSGEAGNRRTEIYIVN